MHQRVCIACFEMPQKPGGLICGRLIHTGQNGGVLKGMGISHVMHAAYAPPLRYVAQPHLLDPQGQEVSCILADL